MEKVDEKAALLKEAEEYRRIADEHMQAAKDQLKTFLMTGIFVISTVVIVAACLGWFASNHLVEATGAQIQATAEKYYLATKGSDSTYDDMMNKLRPWNGEMEAKNYQIDGGEVQELQVLTNGDTSKWYVEANSHFQNIEGENGLQPGASGKLTFYVIPDENADKLTLDISSNWYAWQEKMIEGQSDPIQTELLMERAEDAQALNLLDGHIFCFYQYDGNLYSEWISPDEPFVWEKENMVSGTAYPITIYWLWPKTLAQLLLPEGAAALRGLPAIIAESDRQKIAESIQNEPEKYFLKVDNEAEDHDLVMDKLPSMNTVNYNRNAYAILSGYYNRADQYIGTHIEYLIFEIAAKEQ